ncbi:MAG: 6-carboxytetrahydropterin synthase QueD [Deltaproteobacteria bacterium]|nr:6-carboxytetrahydropterin synthase QueD [Deltaproteobacteria bacterium]
MYELSIEASFSSAHNLRGYEGACENLHGHNWRVELSVSAQRLSDTGMAVDFKRLKTEAKRVIERLDHKYLNEVPPFDRENATAENIARYIHGELKKSLNDGNIKVKKVRVWESDDASASYCEPEGTLPE